MGLGSVEDGSRHSRFSSASSQLSETARLVIALSPVRRKPDGPRLLIRSLTTPTDLPPETARLLAEAFRRTPSRAEQTTHGARHRKNSSEHAASNIGYSSAVRELVSTSQVEDVAGSRRSRSLTKDGVDSVAERSKSPDDGADVSGCSRRRVTRCCSRRG
ncbi:transcription elongation factor GreA [Striga asiatica]|uniref:Transcription elongation factor GreA n=1 Tax=Striga asiatica TaxID=4170 RepID=A0A5A7R2K3_STRAF|nr:transcription elongation factor GreA [Striga asiatica]